MNPIDPISRREQKCLNESTGQVNIAALTKKFGVLEVCVWIYMYVSWRKECSCKWTESHAHSSKDDQRTVCNEVIDK